MARSGRATSKGTSERYESRGAYTVQRAAEVETNGITQLAYNTFVDQALGRSGIRRPCQRRWTPPAAAGEMVASPGRPIIAPRGCQVVRGEVRARWPSCSANARLHTAG